MTTARREEIISACEKLYQTMSFKEITLKDIAGATSFTRTSIYNYFHTKEEIFLALMQKEYERWVEELNAMVSDYTTMSAESFSSMLAHSLEKRSMLLKLLSMNHFDMEDNSRPECLVDFKRAYGASIEALRGCLVKFFPDMDAKAQQLLATSEQQAVDYLTSYTCKKGDEMISRWRQLAIYLIVKFNDMAEKKEVDGHFETTPEGVSKVVRPGYPEATARKLIEQTGDRYVIPDWK